MKVRLSVYTLKSGDVGKSRFVEKSRARCYILLSKEGQLSSEECGCHRGGENVQEQCGPVLLGA